MILCFDIGGSRIKAALGGRSLGDVATPVASFDGFVAALRGFVADGVRGVAVSVAGVVDAHTNVIAVVVRGVAVSVAGVVDPDSGVIKVANIPCLDGRRVAADLASALGVPVLVLNDADCFALAEARAGAGVGHRSVFGVILGTGVGGGLVIDGAVVTGAGGYAGEWGHGPVIRDPAFACGCGQVGCVDTIGGARGLERLHLHLTGQALGAEEILRRWKGGEAATVEAWLDLVSGPLAMVVNVVGASVVPVGGGLSNDADLIAALDRAVRARILRKMDRPLVVVAQVSADAGLVGAAAAGEAAFG